MRRAAIAARPGAAMAGRRDAEALLANIADREASSVLCLRRLAMWRGRSLAEDGGLLAAEVERLRRSAARPAAGPVSSGAQAVLFADRGELLACLARDSIAGVLGARWWWPLIFPAALGDAALLRLWTAEARHVPAALHCLGSAGMVPPVLRRLGDDGSRQVAIAIAGAYGLSELAGAVDEAWAGARSGLRSSSVGDDSPALRVEIRAAMPELGGLGLSAAQCLLLGTGLGLLRLPRLVRSARFAAVLPRLALEAASDLSDKSTSIVEQADAGTAVDGFEAHRCLSVPQAADAPRNPTPPGAGCLPSSRMAPAATQDSQGGNSEPRRGDLPGFAKAKQSSDQRLVDNRAAVYGIPVLNSGQADSATPPGPAAKPAYGPRAIVVAPSVDLRRIESPEPVRHAPPETIATRCGGVFFLANAALALGLYSDFSRPRVPALDLPFWDFLALTGAGLLADPAGDPLWPLLAELSGRTAEQAPGHGHAAGDAWRMPAEWCLAFRVVRRRWRWRAGGGRLQVWHGAGFPVVDVARDRRAVARQLHAELAPYAAERFMLERDNALPPPSGEGWTRWRDWLLPYLRCRLALALGKRSQTALRRMLLVPARLLPGAGRIEVRMRLDELPIAVRLAGLDRDTGWIPAAGRSIDFIFEVDDAAQR